MRKFGYHTAIRQGGQGLNSRQKTALLRNFGVFEVRKRKSRHARNPRTGEKLMTGERMVVKFRPGQVVEERVASRQPYMPGRPFLAPEPERAILAVASCGGVSGRCPDTAGPAASQPGRLSGGLRLHFGLRSARQPDLSPRNLASSSASSVPTWMIFRPSVSFMQAKPQRL